MYIIKNIDIYAPAALGRKDILVGGTQILAIEESLEALVSSLPRGRVRVIDGSGSIAIPGLVDNHLHITGGGGEGGFTSRTPEMEFSRIASAGVTSVVGTLGTDASTRSMNNLLAKVKALREQGISAWCYSGNYQLPLRTVTGNLTDDIVLIEEIIGAGEVAIADHRSSQPSSAELTRLASQARVGGLLSGKAGTVNIHVGGGAEGISLLEEAVAGSEIPRTQFVPTHMGRDQALLNQGISWALAGGYVDFTACTVQQFLDEGEIRCSSALKLLLDTGVALDRISFSSDAGGSLPEFNEKGEYQGMTVGSCTSLLDEVRLAVHVEGLDLPTALAPVTENPAKRLKLQGKGRLQAGNDADLVILDQQSLKPLQVFAGGRLISEGGADS
jgi:beta-aspartyl-dipeptidase (metallo-type)